MDRNNPSSQYQGYFNLQNFPYNGFSPNVNIGTSQIPSSSSHQTHASQIPSFSSPGTQSSQIPSFFSQDPTQTPAFTPHQQHVPSQTEDTQPQTPLDSKERRNWRSQDDLVLVSGWLNTSKDSIVGNDQRAGTFWQRIADYYMSSDHVLRGAEVRTVDNCKQRWGRLSRDVSHFCGTYAQAVDDKGSGMNDVDTMQTAHELYYITYKKKFTLDHAWNVLKGEPKWCSLALMNPTSKTSSNKRKGSDAALSTASVECEQEIRPPGIKAMKAKRYKSKEKAGQSAEYQQLWDNKEKDMAAKKELQKMSLLDSLIAKKEPLDEEDKIIKKKLTAELFG